MKQISEFTDEQLCNLVDNRWRSSETIWDTVKKTYDDNVRVYKGDPKWLSTISLKKSKVRANRIFVNTEAVINSLIANPPKPIVLNGRNSPESKTLSSNQEKYFQIKYTERNIKEIIRKGLRNLYFSRLIVLKPFWNAKINDFDARAVDPTKVRFSKTSTKEDDSEFAIEEITDQLSSVIKRFPSMEKELLESVGLDSSEDVLIENPDVTYYEAWCWDYVIFKLKNKKTILGKIRNPYWDWDGILITSEEEKQLLEAEGDARRDIFSSIRAEQSQRQVQKSGDKVMPQLENSSEPVTLSSYLFNHFDHPRKPYIFATIFNNENTPIGQTDMITQAIPLQENIDETKRDICQNAKLVNGIIKVDASVMEKSDAQRLRFETEGIIWGKGAVAGVSRETGPALPAFVIENMRDSRNEIDDIMAASSAFKGQREGQETRGGRLALIDQSFLRLNELVQVIDYVNYELFNWFYQLAKVRYTEHHYAKTLGKSMAEETLTLIQDDFRDGSEIRIVSGKTLPEDRQFKYEQAQADVKDGIIGKVDYLEAAGYSNPKEMAKNGFMEKVNPMEAFGVTDEERKSIPPPVPQSTLREQVAFNDLPDTGKIQFLSRMGIQVQPQDLQSNDRSAPVVLNYADLPPDGKAQLAAKAGIILDPQILMAETMKAHEDKQATETNKLNLEHTKLQGASKAEQP
jgi:hypothetical protein